MNTQRENDIAILEAKQKAQKLFEEWQRDYLAQRAERGNNEDGTRAGQPEDYQAAYAEDYGGGGATPYGI